MKSRNILYLSDIQKWLRGRGDAVREITTPTIFFLNEKQVVAMNPYAALCNQMLSEAFGKLRRGETV